MTSSETTVGRWFPAINAIATTAVFVIAVVVALAGAHSGHWLALALIPIAWLYVAFDPLIGRWGNVSK